MDVPAFSEGELRWAYAAMQKFPENASVTASQIKSLTVKLSPTGGLGSGFEPFPGGIITAGHVTKGLSAGPGKLIAVGNRLYCIDNFEYDPEYDVTVFTVYPDRVARVPERTAGLKAGQSIPITPIKVLGDNFSGLTSFYREAATMFGEDPNTVSDKPTKSLTEYVYKLLGNEREGIKNLGRRLVETGAKEKSLFTGHKVYKSLSGSGLFEEDGFMYYTATLTDGIYAKKETRPEVISVEPNEGAWPASGHASACRHSGDLQKNRAR